MTATVDRALPQPRSDSATVTVGKTSYIVGGYDGTNPDAWCWPRPTATPSRPSPLCLCRCVIQRSPPPDGLIYVFGGQAITGAQAGQPVNAIQVVNPRRHTASTIGHLPVPLEAAAAVTIGTQIYLAGGESTVAQPVTPGVGTTQLGPPPPGANPGTGATSATATAATVPKGGSVPSGDAPRCRRPPPRHPAPNGRGLEVVGRCRRESSLGTSTVSTIWAFNPTTVTMLSAGRLQVPVSHSSVDRPRSHGLVRRWRVQRSAVATVQMLTPITGFGTAGASGAGSPYFGLQLLIADRGNNRFLLMDSAMKITWTYPSATSPPDPYGFVFPDDAFFIDNGSCHHLEPGGERDHRRDRLSLGQDPLGVRPPEAAWHRARVPARAR